MVAIAQRRGDRDTLERLYMRLVAHDGDDVMRWARRLHRLVGERRWHDHTVSAVVQLRRAGVGTTMA
ncbi:hypothetical protein JS533_011615 [Bifidobacterium amazonense]|uniref:Transposase n=1 Tax=Bifidobacterium amazonense TaxID=2809027 RepID=A0ABS9VXY0_9BIFI|nr:hypothetical protein [Bifidobacterium amazonense]MCH9276907.1 hypothetical protein [Bifidobacterium amazonense]